LKSIQVQRTQIESSINNLNRYKQEAEAAMLEVGNLQKQLDEKLEYISSTIASIEKDLNDVKMLDWLISHIPFIKLHRMSVAMVQLSDRVNYYLASMGDTLRINISSFSEKKSTKGAPGIKATLKSEIKVEIVDGEKNIDPRLYSDGETAKLSNALIRGLHDVASQSGHGCNLILMDEIFSFVDQSNSQALVESFRDVEAATLFVTDNSGHVHNLMVFDEVWIARKQNGMTTLEVIS